MSQKAQEYGYHPEIILAGKRRNDITGEYVASRIMKQMISVKGSDILVLGIIFKEKLSGYSQW